MTTQTWERSPRGLVLTIAGPGHLLARAPRRSGWKPWWVTVRGDLGWTKVTYRPVPTTLPLEDTP